MVPVAAMRCVVAWLVVVVNLLPVHGAAVDKTIVDSETGEDVVDAVIELINRNCVFLMADNEFLKRIAKVESEFGTAPSTDLGNGGIWQVEQVKFTKTQSSEAAQTMSVELENIKKIFSITWSSVTFSDLKKPLYSGLAARLVLMWYWESLRPDSNLERHDIDANTFVDIPIELGDQAFVYANNYKTSGSTTTFTNAVSTSYECKNAGVDLIWDMDGSATLGSTKFSRTLDFAEGVTRSLNVSPDRDQVALLQFSDRSYSGDNQVVFWYNKYSTTTDTCNAILSTAYDSGSFSYTHRSLRQLFERAIIPSVSGIRPWAEGHPMVAIVVTDGPSTDGTKTVAFAAEVHKTGMEVIVVQIGTIFRQDELDAIATDPNCQYRYIVKGFKMIMDPAFKDQINRQICRSPVKMNLTESMTQTLPKDGKQNCKILVYPEGAAITAKLNSGSADFLVAGDTLVFPNKAYNQQDVSLVTDTDVTVYVDHPGPGTDAVEVPCSLINTGSAGVHVNFTVRKDEDQCASNPCQNGGTCTDLTGSYNCTCDERYDGVNCENDVNPCISNPCLHGGECANVDLGKGMWVYSCNCPRRYRGVDCQIDTDPCASDPCQNAGTCSNVDSGDGFTYNCTCPEFYTGTNCENSGKIKKIAP